MGADLVVVEGDLIICDATVAGPGGYYSDFARTFSRGEPTQQSRARYKEAYESLQEALTLIKPGRCTELFARLVRALHPDCRDSTASTEWDYASTKPPGYAAAIPTNTW